MIEIAKAAVETGSLTKKYEAGGIEGEIIKILDSSTYVYKYDSMGQLEFELTLRKSIVKAGKDLADSRLAFKVFNKAACNTEYWNLTEEGGFLQKSNVKSSDAIRDIYVNSSRYGTECATAIVIVYFKSLVDILPEKLFLELFPHIYLYSWEYLDSDLGIHDNKKPADRIPGDCTYFKNPDYDEDKPEWQGENVVYFGNKIYYGHGIGITTEGGIIRKLNSKRKPDSQTSAYLMELARRPGFKSLYESFHGYSAEATFAPGSH